MVFSFFLVAHFLVDGCSDLSPTSFIFYTVLCYYFASVLCVGRFHQTKKYNQKKERLTGAVTKIQMSVKTSDEVEGLIFCLVASIVQSQPTADCGTLKCGTGYVCKMLRCLPRMCCKDGSS